MRLSLALAFTALVACGGAQNNLDRSKIADTPENRGVIDTLETYRLAVERKDGPALMLMASKDYWEDGGTPNGSDDYGFAGLQEVLTGRFQEAESIRYSLRYVRVRYDELPGGGRRAYVDVLIDASYTIRDARNELVRKDKRDQNQIVLQWEDEQWKFLSGM
jgi:hypothetical protein